MAAIIAMLIPSAGEVAAHTGFESSTPGAGEVISQSVGMVTIRFTGEATPVGEEFVALTAAGQLQEPVEVTTADDMTFVITFDPPLAGGEIGIRWNVQAADAHPIDGAFAFTVDAPAPTTTPTTMTPTTVATSPEATTGPTESAVAPVTTVPSATVAPATSASGLDDQAIASPADTGSETPNGGAAVEATTLDEFLSSAADGTPGETTATVGRVVGFLGVTLGIGALAFVATALRGRRDEVRAVLAGIRLLGIVIVIGAAIEYIGVSRIAGESLSGGWSTAPGFATVLRVVGGIALAFGVADTMMLGRVQRPIRRPSVARSLSAAVAVEPSARESAGREIDDPIMRWTADARSWPALAGVGLIIASFWFDGHTVSKGFRPLHALVNSVHVAAGAVWVGGVVSMAVVVWTRRHQGRPMRAVELVVRFSKVATIALASVVAAGVVMAYLVLDSFGELTGTPWGKILLLKTAAVALAMAGGAYNHFRLLPALEADSESPEVLAELRSTVTAEAIMLVFVVIVTAWLVAAAS